MLLAQQTRLSMRMSATFEVLDSARAHHQAGRLREAEVLYRQILQAEPNHADALHLLGVVAHQRGRHDMAVELIGRAIALAGDQAAYHSNLAEAYRSLGNLAEAEQSLRRALTLAPDSVHALNNLGIVLGGLRRPAEAVAALTQALRLRGDFAEAHNNLGIVYHAEGKLDEAIAHFRLALQSNPHYVDACGNLGAALKEQSKFDEAVETYRRALQLAPQDSRLHLNLGAVHQARGRLDEAISCYLEALRLDPRSPLAHTNLGTALAEQDRFDEAAARHRQAIALDPRLASAHLNLAAVLRVTRQPEAAAESYREAIRCDPRCVEALLGLGRLLEDTSRFDAALEYYEQAAQANPKSVPAQMRRADVFQKIGRTKDAVAGYRAAVELQPDHVDAYNNLAVAYDRLGYPDAAVECCRLGLERLPDSWELYLNLATALGFQGRLDESVAAARKAVELQPKSPVAFSNVLFALNLVPGYDPARLFEEHLEWGRRYAEPLSAAAAPAANDRSPERRLRVGYVSSHFRDHAVNFFVEPLLAAHDHGDFEIFCYSTVERPDDATRRLEAAADHWRAVRYQRDEQIAQLIRDDKIDILVDLAGHIAGNSLLVFARKPAPVQVTYLGYQNTTGMTAMNYRLTDALADPPGATDRYYTERLVRLDDAFFCYRPADEAPPVAPLPAHANGHITFGSFNNFRKVTPPTVDAWLEILTRVPNSRLLVLANRGGYAQQHCQQLARQRGIEPARIEFFDKCPRARFYQLLQRADVALDPFPFNGHTTSCDSIWLGVPVVMLQGTAYASRFGASVLANVGLDDLIARSTEEYVAAAVELAGDVDRLAALRGTLRPRMAESVLLDFGGFARKVEAAYRHMWREWCQAN
jgi:predicted O-linked N-acetylglucosamine transferase (SPINDLY family)